RPALSVGELEHHRGVAVGRPKSVRMIVQKPNSLPGPSNQRRYLVLYAGDQREHVRVSIITSQPIPGLRVDELILDEEEREDSNQQRRLGADSRLEAAVGGLRRRGRS